MDLSDEQKQRIFEEERQKVAEEQYRAQVRQALAIGTPPSKASDPTSGLKLTPKIVGIAFGALILGLGMFALIHRTSDTNPAALEAKTPAESQPSKDAVERPSPVKKLTTAEIANKATPAVVLIENINEDGQRVSQGSGYVLSTDGIVITNYHVVRGANSLTVRLPSRGTVRTDRLVGYDPEHDLAAIQLSEHPTTTLSIEESENVKVGDRVIAIGSPLGLENTVSEGIISALRETSGMHVIQTTASVSHGSSGGPLLNESGRVIGITTAVMRDGQNLNFVVSAKHVSDLLSNRRELSLADMLGETRLTTPLASNTISVPARNIVQLPFVVSGQQGATLEGSYSIHGGTGNDVVVSLISGDQRVIVNSGVVKASGQFKQQLQQGRYALLFDNRMSTFSSKSITPDLALSSYR